MSTTKISRLCNDPRAEYCYVRLGEAAQKESTVQAHDPTPPLDQVFVQVHFTNTPDLILLAATCVHSNIVPPVQQVMSPLVRAISLLKRKTKEDRRENHCLLCHKHSRRPSSAETAALHAMPWSARGS